MEKKEKAMNQPLPEAKRKIHSCPSSSPFCSLPNRLVAVANLWASRNSYRLGKKMEEARRGGGAQGAEEQEVAHREKTLGNGGGAQGKDRGNKKVTIHLIS
jgi:hypothetical protein